MARMYPKNSQGNLRYPKSLLHSPFALILLLRQQLHEEDEPAAKAPPYCRGGTQTAADEERNEPAVIDAQEDGDARVERGSYVIGCGWRSVVGR